MVRMRYYLRIMEATALYFEIEIRQSETIDYFSAWPTRSVYWKRQLCWKEADRKSALPSREKRKRNFTKDSSIPKHSASVQNSNSEAYPIRRMNTSVPVALGSSILEDCIDCQLLFFRRGFTPLEQSQDTLVAASSSNILHTLASVPITTWNHSPRQFSDYYPLP